MASPLGINFRSTSGYVTDGPNDTYCLRADGYPTTRGGLTFGWADGDSHDVRNRNSGIDVRLAGVHFNTSAGTVAIFRLDLPNDADTYTITGAFGDASYAQSPYVELRDGATTVFKTIDLNITGQDRWTDPNGSAQYTSAEWPGDNTTLEEVFSNDELFIHIGDNVDERGHIGHISLAWSADIVLTPGAGALTLTGQPVLRNVPRTIIVPKGPLW